MALYLFLCGSAVMIILLSNGCHSQQQPACGLAPNNPIIVGSQNATVGSRNATVGNQNATVGSQNAAAGSWPWVASLQVNGKHRCGGSLISDMWVLTHRACVSDLPYNMTVVLGLESISGPNLNNVSKAIDKVILHPYSSSLYQFNDIALLKLSSPVNFTDYIQPVCLASANSTFYTGVNSWVVGFGANSSGDSNADTLQEVRVPVVGNNECDCAYPYFDIPDNEICAAFRSGGNVSCQREWGGPMMIKKGSVWVQSGITSFGSCELPNFPGVYTRVSLFEDWIKNHTGSSKPGFVDYMSQGVDSDLTFVCPSIPTPTDHPYPTTLTCTVPSTTTPLTSISSTTITPVTTTTTKQGVVAMRVKIFSTSPLSEDFISSTIIQQIKEELVSKGLASDITLRLVTSVQLGLTTQQPQ